MSFGTKTMAAGLMAAVLPTSAALAAFDLQISEMWPGNEPGENLTSDWFEITNFGDMAWTAAVDGGLWYDDDSFDVTKVDPIVGFAAIAPGESVVVVLDEAAGVADWQAVWSPVAAGFQVGYTDGSGLGQGGDGVGLFLDGDMNAVIVEAEQIAGAFYPDAESFGGQSYDTTLAAFSTVGNAAGAVATIALNDESQPGIGSPGAIPEPGSLALIGLGGLAMVSRRR